MPRASRRQHLARLLAPRLEPDEEIVGLGAAWFARLRGSSHLLFVGRHYRLVAVTTRRLLVVARRRRGDVVLVDAALSSLTIVRASRAGVLGSVVLDAGEAGRFVLEFRPRERALGRDLMRELRERAARS
jgi:hypothetical protein